MGGLRRKVGLFPALLDQPLGNLLWPEGVTALLVGAGGGYILVQNVEIAARATLVGDAIGVLGVLLGVVFAAFALLIALLSDEYLRALDSVAGGILTFMQPFMIAAGMQVTALIIGLSYRATAGTLSPGVEATVFVVWAFIFVYALADVLALIRTVSLHGLLRAQQEKGDAPEPTVRNLRR